MVNCQNCEAPVSPSAERCDNCGAKLLHRRVVFGAARREDFSLTPEEPFEFNEPTSLEEWQFPHRLAPAIIAEPPAEAALAESYGGFFRRALALLVDFFVVALLSAVMGAMAYVGYKVGLAAHQRALSGSTLMPLLTLLTTAGTFLSMSYFVLFHGMDGKTIGKWCLNLRVVGAGKERIGYRRACLRWIASVAFAPLLLGFLWVLWSREKRAWHDYLARTWVIKE
jgi:uncharacterized RDD family membrane protein YckC